MDDIDKFIMSELRDIKSLQRDHTAELKVYNIQLADHIARTTALENRFIPVEEHVKFIQKLVKVVTIIAGLALSALSIIKSL